MEEKRSVRDSDVKMPEITWSLSIQTLHEMPKKSKTAPTIVPCSPIPQFVLSPPWGSSQRDVPEFAKAGMSPTRKVVSVSCSSSSSPSASFSSTDLLSSPDSELRRQKQILYERKLRALPKTPDSSSSLSRSPVRSSSMSSLGSHFISDRMIHVGEGKIRLDQLGGSDSSALHSASWQSSPAKSYTTDESSGDDWEDNRKESKLLSSLSLSCSDSERSTNASDSYSPGWTTSTSGSYPSIRSSSSTRHDGTLSSRSDTSASPSAFSTMATTISTSNISNTGESHDGDLVVSIESDEGDNNDSQSAKKSRSSSKKSVSSGIVIREVLNDPDVDEELSAKCITLSINEISGQVMDHGSDNFAAIRQIETLALARVERQRSDFTNIAAWTALIVFICFVLLYRSEVETFCDKEF